MKLYPNDERVKDGPAAARRKLAPLRIELTKLLKPKSSSLSDSSSSPPPNMASISRAREAASAGGGLRAYARVEGREAASDGDPFEPRSIPLTMILATCVLTKRELPNRAAGEVRKRGETY